MREFCQLLGATMRIGVTIVFVSCFYPARLFDANEFVYNEFAMVSLASDCYAFSHVSALNLLPGAHTLERAGCANSALRGSSSGRHKHAQLGKGK